ncbi:MAG TPA: hypothetical protein DEB17_08370 [Chlorobaculum sp.]|uniref:Uncharacterized protein n=1 Tax=Chlorobaculum tepidum (strain ATCC 49652 / DSM 12025 / NBRC 103806 / TLS) TaxID=194439 RepID=Q8KDB3_CHLTE|nr:hypothetical protein CT1141 [Chlorobaculum tepidum TLS]HBU23986.1 hypothetical protein [Chlorobaculum sp.]
MTAMYFDSLVILYMVVGFSFCDNLYKKILNKCANDFDFYVTLLV